MRNQTRKPASVNTTLTHAIMSTFSLVLHSDVAMSLLRSQTGLSIHHCSADPTLSSVDTMMVGCRRTTAPVSRE